MLFSFQDEGQEVSQEGVHHRLPNELATVCALIEKVNILGRMPSIPRPVLQVSERNLCFGANSFDRFCCTRVHLCVVGVVSLVSTSFGNGCFFQISTPPSETINVVIDMLSADIIFKTISDSQ